MITATLDRDGDPGAVLVLDDVSHQYETAGGPVCAVQNVSLQVSAGDCIVVVGPSGSGKSTLLSLMAGYFRPSQGRVLFQGVDWGSASESERAERRRSGIGFVFQSASLVSVLSVRQNVAVPALLRGSHPSTAARDADEALGRFGLDDLGARWPEQLSGGQQQRVAVARATVCGQSLILADEPTGALDTENSQTVFRALASRADESAAVVIVSHDTRATDYATRVLRISDGCLDAA